jgi:hypothetical protein
VTRRRASGPLSATPRSSRWRPPAPSTSIFRPRSSPSTIGLQDAWLRYLPSHDAAEAQQAQQVQQEPRTGGFSQKNVAQTEENERNGSATSATDGADGKRNSPPERNGIISTKSNTVADVADVALVRGNGGEAPSDDLAIPAFLDRNRKQDPDRLCPLGPGGDGDSLDDLQ